MGRFVQLHFLTSYPPANLNRDDLGRPKTAVMGGFPRLRISSQSLKRAWRKSNVFESALKGHVGIRTKSVGQEIHKALLEKGVSEKKANDWTKAIAGVFGKLKKDSLDIEQLAHFSPEEQTAINELVEILVERGSEPTGEELKLLRKQHSAADIALFGRMLASSPAYNMEAAAQVAHAISVHKVDIEDDFFTAVDDLNKGEEDLGAGHMGETEFAAGLFYQYVCIDRELLKDNLGEDVELANKTLGALIEAAATVSPTGKQNSFASRARASYMLCETGDQQPRSLAAAFLKPIIGTDMLANAISAMEQAVEYMDVVYGACADHRVSFNVLKGEGSLDGIIDAVAIG
ncbi:MAG: type I-E CRISPR-associated protein Cas7/Cse4/CasC [Candidatus Thiodiazotropha sp.]